MKEEALSMGFKRTNDQKDLNRKETGGWKNLRDMVGKYMIKEKRGEFSR